MYEQLVILIWPNEHHTIIATDNGEIVGFGDIDSSGYLDRF